MLCNRWRIAASEAALPKGMFIQWRLPPPETVDYKPFSEIVPAAEGSSNQTGYTKVVLTWVNMTRIELAILRRKVDSLGRNTRLFMTVDKNIGTKPSEEWTDISGYPQLSYPTRDAAGRSTTGVYPVQLILNNVTDLGDAY